MPETPNRRTGTEKCDTDHMVLARRLVLSGAGALGWHVCPRSAPTRGTARLSVQRCATTELWCDHCAPG